MDDEGFIVLNYTIYVQKGKLNSLYIWVSVFTNSVCLPDSEYMMVYHKMLSYL